ncbi:site-specific integrase [Rhizobium sp. Root1220]|uniref:tyrosine-type recombinase/integrase n=1 Tax=Rhizobium sp. Root1220 TaxID=1736432 RepID=UPI000AC6E8EF|nr:site-specific integrase [Rhizobium sp. Root1220]
MPPELEIALNALDRSKGGTIRKTMYGEAFSEKSLTGMMAHWCKQAGIAPGYTLHGLRRSFASELAEGAADPFAIMKAMGHKDISTTMIYLKDLNAEPMAQRAAAAASKRRR